MNGQSPKEVVIMNNTKSVTEVINECKKLISESTTKDDINVDGVTRVVEMCLQQFSNSDLGRKGSSRRNDLMSRPIIMYLWHLIKQGKIVDVSSLIGSGGVSGKFLLVPMYDDEGKPTLQAIIPIVASSMYDPEGEYQIIRFVEKLSDFKTDVDGHFIFRTSSDGGIYVDECTSDAEYFENLANCRSFDNAWKITTANGAEYFESPALAQRNIITINNELYHYIQAPHCSVELNDPAAEKASDGYITQDIVIPIIRGIGSSNKFIYSHGTDKQATAYRASVPVSRFMALASLFVSHDRYKDDLAKDPDNDLLKRKARVNEWDMIEGVEQTIVDPYRNMFPGEDELKVLTLAIDMFILTLLGIEAIQGDKPDVVNLVLGIYFYLFGTDEEIKLIDDPNTPSEVIQNTLGYRWLSYFISLIDSWENVPYVNHKDLRRSHNVMYNLEFTYADFNDAHGALAGAFAGLSKGQYTDTVTVPAKRKVDGKTVHTTKQMQVFKNHYGISAYILYDFDKYMYNEGATHYRGQFISQLRTIAIYNRKHLDNKVTGNLGIAPDQVRMFEKFLVSVYGYGTDTYWKLV